MSDNDNIAKKMRKAMWDGHQNNRLYPGVLVEFEGEVTEEDKITDDNGCYYVVLDGAKTPYQCITAGFELNKEHLGYSVMVIFKKVIDRWVIVTLNGNRSK